MVGYKITKVVGLLDLVGFWWCLTSVVVHKH